MSLLCCTESISDVVRLACHKQRKRERERSGQNEGKSEDIRNNKVNGRMGNWR